MSGFSRLSGFFWRFMKIVNRRVSSLYMSRTNVGHLVLLLTTTGRKSGLLRTTPLQYEEIDGIIYVAAARGQKADWFRNIVANPHVEVQVKRNRFHGLAEPITDPKRIADFLALRRQRHPRMIGIMLLFHGLPPKPNRVHLEQLATKLALVAIRPDKVK